jgi:hypothetical protein
MVVTQKGRSHFRQRNSTQSLASPMTASSTENETAKRGLFIVLEGLDRSGTSLKCTYIVFIRGSRRQVNASRMVN